MTFRNQDVQILSESQFKWMVVSAWISEWVPMPCAILLFEESVDRKSCWRKGRCLDVSIDLWSLVVHEEVVRAYRMARGA